MSLPERRLAQLPPDRWPLPTVTAYDRLLRHRRPVEGIGYRVGSFGGCRGPCLVGLKPEDGRLVCR